MFHFVRHASMKRMILELLVAVLLLGSAAQAHAEPLHQAIQNSGFETGSFSGWTQAGDTDFTFVFGPGSISPHSGLYQAFLGPGAPGGSLSQTFETYVGITYTLDFWLANDGGAGNPFTAEINNVPLVSLTTSDNFGYTEYTQKFITTQASTTLTFQFENDSSYFYLDDVTVTASEPGSLTLLCLGFASFGGIVWMKKRGNGAAETVRPMEAVGPESSPATP